MAIWPFRKRETLTPRVTQGNVLQQEFPPLKASYVEATEGGGLLIRVTGGKNDEQRALAGDYRFDVKKNTWERRPFIKEEERETKKNKERRGHGKTTYVKRKYRADKNLGFQEVEVELTKQLTKQLTEQLTKNLKNGPKKKHFEKLFKWPQIKLVRDDKGHFVRDDKGHFQFKEKLTGKVYVRQPEQVGNNKVKYRWMQETGGAGLFVDQQGSGPALKKALDKAHTQEMKNNGGYKKAVKEQGRQGKENPQCSEIKLKVEKVGTETKLVRHYVFGKGESAVHYRIRPMPQGPNPPKRPRFILEKRVPGKGNQKPFWQVKDSPETDPVFQKICEVERGDKKPTKPTPVYEVTKGKLKGKYEPCKNANELIVKDRPDEKILPNGKYRITTKEALGQYDDSEQVVQKYNKKTDGRGQEIGWEEYDAGTNLTKITKLFNEVRGAVQFNEHEPAKQPVKLNQPEGKGPPPPVPPRIHKTHGQGTGRNGRPRGEQTGRGGEHGPGHQSGLPRSGKKGGNHRGGPS